MLPSVCRSLSLQRTVSGVFGGAVLAAAVAAPAAAEDVFLGYTDLRLTFSTMPFDGYSGPGGVSGNFNSAIRGSVMAIGPLCSVLPINCYTPPRIGSDATRSQVDTYGTYDDLMVERNYTFTDNRSYHYDWLLGFELSFNNWSESDDAVPDIDVSAVALTVHFGWGLEIATRLRGRWHWELTPFLGAGLATASYNDTTIGGANNDNDIGFYYEVGARLGSYYTWPGGFQIGGEIRYVFANADVDPIAPNTSFNFSGPTFGLVLGYRF